MKIGRKICVESLHRIFIRRGAPEADETVRADQNNAALRQSRPGGIEPRLAAIDDRDESAPTHAEMVEPRPIAEHDEMIEGAR